VADITYVPTWAGFLYLAVVLDAFSRRVVGWAMATTPKPGKSFAMILRSEICGHGNPGPEFVWNHSRNRNNRQAAAPAHRGSHARLLTEARPELKTQLSAECHRVKPFKNEPQNRGVAGARLLFSAHASLR
jgi:hypothetical protein